MEVKEKQELEDLFDKTHIWYDAKFDYGDYIKVKKENKYGMLDSTGKEIIPLKYDWIDSFCGDLSVVTLNKKYGAVNKIGKEIIPIKYDQLTNFDFDITLAKLNNKWGVVDKTGGVLIQFIYDDLRFSEVNIIAAIGFESGVLDKNGNVLIPIKYKEITSFTKGIARIRIGGKWGAINKSSVVIQPIYDSYNTSWTNSIDSW